MATLLSFISWSFITLIRIYQCLISPLLKRNCRFKPSCSQYCIEVLQKFGLIKGCLLTIQRILKCHPLQPGGDDPVPVKPLDT